MGACCTKFGSYLLRKEESKVMSNGGTPKLINKLEHKQSFVVTHTTYEEKPTDENILPPPDENIDLSPQHHEDKLQPNKEDAETNSKENSETEVKVVTKTVIRSNSKSSSSSSSSSSDSELIENGTNSGNTITEESEIKQDLAEKQTSLAQDCEETNHLLETPTPESKEGDKPSSSSSEDENEKSTSETCEQPVVPENVTVTVVEFTESANDPETKSISSKSSSSSESGVESENHIPKIVEPKGETVSIKSEKESNSSVKSSTSETEINFVPESEIISRESPVPEIKVSEYPTDETEVEKLSSEESLKIKDDTKNLESKSTSSSSSSSSSSDSEEEPIDEAPKELPDHDDQNGEQEIESFEPEENEGLTNGDMVETLNVAETTNGHKSENSGSDSTSSSSSDDHDEIEVNDEVPVYDREFPKSYAQLVTPSGFNPGAGLEVANDNVPEGDFE